MTTESAKSLDVTFPLVRGSLHKKLEDLVLRAMDSPDELPLEWDDAIDIAKDEGFGDVLDWMKDVHSEIGEIQARRNIQRAKQKAVLDLKEKRMNDYFSLQDGAMLPILEDGLDFAGSEVDDRTGRIDIRAKDVDGKLVKIELKARKYDPGVAVQLQRYLNDPDNPDARLIFAAPEVHRNYFFGFRHFGDRVKFIELKEVSPDNYVFAREVSVDDFEFNPDSRKWKRKKLEGNGSVRVTTRVPQGRWGDGNGGRRRKKAQEGKLVGEEVSSVQPEIAHDTKNEISSDNRI